MKEEKNMKCFILNNKNLNQKSNQIKSKDENDSKFTSKEKKWSKTNDDKWNKKSNEQQQHINNNINQIEYIRDEIISYSQLSYLSKIKRKLK